MHLLTKIVLGAAAGTRLLSSDNPVEEVARVILYAVVAFAVLVSGFGIVVVAYLAWALTRDTPVDNPSPQPIVASVPWSQPTEQPPASLIERQPQTVPEGAEILSDTEHSTVYVMPGESVGRVIFK